MRKIQEVDTTEERINPREVLSLEKAAEYLREDIYWVEELLLIGDLESLSIKDLDYYLMDAPTEEMEHRND
jgi:hypothetical protein